MKLNKMNSIISGCLLLFCLLTASAQETKPAAATPADPELERVKELSKQYSKAAVEKAKAA